MENRYSNVVKNEAKQPQVFNVRGKRVVLDREVAALVGIDTKYLNRVVKRNANFFNEDIAFQVTQEELLRCQNEFCGDKFVTSKTDGRGGSRYLPFVFTAEGIQVLERVLKREIPIVFEEQEVLPEIVEKTWSEGTIVLFHPDDSIELNVRYEGRSVWLTQEQMAQLFGTTKQNISLHIANVFEEKEQEEWATVKDFLTVQTEGNRQITRNIAHYNLDVIIAVGFRVKSVYGSRFRHWASQVLDFFLLQGHNQNTECGFNPCQMSGCQMKIHVDQQRKEISELKEEMKNMGNNMVSRSEIKDMMQWFTDMSQGKEMLIHQNAIQEANYAYISIYAEAYKTIYIVDNYIGVKTIELLCAGARNGVNVIIFSENAGKQLTKAEVDMVLEGRANIDIRFKHNGGIYHDRYIVLDYNTDSEKIYDCGCSSKDAGGKISSINLCENKEMYHYLVDKLLQQPELVLK